MSLKNTLVKTLMRTFMKKKSEDEMLKLIETSGVVVEYDENGLRKTNFEIPDELTFLQRFYKGIRIEEMYYSSKLKRPNEQKVVLMFHGGGYLGKINDIYTEWMCRLCKASKDYLVISVEYTTSQKGTFPAAYNDALASWEFLMNEGFLPENVVIMGDSAGGGLALALTMYLRDNNVNVKAYMGLSPWVNLNCTSECFINPQKKKMDPLFGSSNVLDTMAKMYVGDNDINDWRISPLFGSFENLPKMYITYGDCEILRDDIQALYDKASKENDVTLKVYKGCQHDIQTGGTKEAKKSWNDIEEFFSKL